GKVDRKCFKCGVGRLWSDSDEDVDLKKDEICLMAHESIEADPRERDPASISEGIRASVIADTKLKPFMQSRTNFVQITKKTSPSATVRKLGQGLAKGKI
ncbi:hypothetical protein Tco_0617690, partial [Tanacetum coccineum]